MRDIVASQSGHEVISLQKMDSLLLFLNVTEKLRRFLRRNAGGFLDKNSFESKFASLCLDDHFTGALCSETKKNC